MINNRNGETDGSQDNSLPGEGQINTPAALNDEFPDTSNSSNKRGMEENISRMDTKKKNKRKETIGWIVSLATAVVLALLLRFFCF